MEPSATNIEAIHISHLPPDLPVYAALYRDVDNAAFLREQLLNGNEAFEYALIDATTILSRRHALAAVFRAVNDYLNDRLRSRNVHSETVFALCSNNSIGDSFRRFGISDTTKDLLVLKIATKPEVTAESVSRHLSENVQGTSVPFTDENLERVVDLAKLRKVHKLGAGTGGGGGGGGKKRLVNGDYVVEVDEMREVERQVLGLMAIRGAT